MNPRTTVILALVAALLGGFVYFYELEGDSARQAAKADAQRIHPGLESDAVRAVEFTTQDGVPARFERWEGRWRVVRPVEAPADATALDAIAHTLTSLPRAGTVASIGDLGDYGLGDGARRIRFEVEDGDGLLGLRIGRNTPVGGNVYVARLGDSEVAFVESYRVNAFNRDFDDLRERRIFELDEGDVEALRIDWPDANASQGRAGVSIERTTDDGPGSWRMTAPAESRVDDVVLRKLLSDLSFLSAAGFVDERSPEALAALADEQVALAWRRAGADSEERTRIGGEFGNGLILEGSDGRLFTIARERLDDFPRRLVAYRFKTLSEFDIGDARRLVLAFAGGEGEIVAELRETGWTSEDVTLIPDRISDLVRAAASLRAEDIVADEMGPEELAGLGLEPARATIKIESGSSGDDPSKPLAEIRIGRLDWDRGLFVQRADSPGVYLLPTSSVASLPISAERFAEDFSVSESGSTEPTSVETEEADDGLLLDLDPLEGVDLP